MYFTLVGEQMISSTGVFQGFYVDFKNAVVSLPCSPHVLTQAPLSNFEEPHPPMFSAPAGNPDFLFFVVFLWLNG